MTTAQGRVFSGVQPTGNLHLGNYLGAIKQWVSLQKDYECIFCVVDLHAITVPQDPKELREHTRQMAAAYIAAGIDPENTIIYNQSAVSGHSELAWILGCHTPLGWLNRMTQFKDKAGKEQDSAPLGLFAYPVLMAADILLYKATHVPVGDDQKQHLELARNIANSFNVHYFGEKYENSFFPIPEPLILGEATRVMSLQDGTTKMSKSDPSEKSRINLTDDADTIARKFKKAKADAGHDGIFYDKENRPEISNLMTIYAALADCSLEEAGNQFASSGNGDFKKALAELAVEKLAPITSEMQRLNADPAYLDNILKSGAEKATEKAEATMKDVHALVGFLR